MKEVNVIGTMQLLAACQKAHVRHQAGGEVVDHRVRRLAEGPGPVHRGHGAGVAAALGLRQGLGRGRGLRARLRPPPARRGSRCCGSPTSSGPGCRRRCRRTSSCRSSRPCSASTRACSSCHEDDGLEVLRLRDRAGPPGHVQRRRRRGHAAVAGDPPRRQADPAAAGTAGVLGRRPRPAGPAGRLLARAAALPHLRPRGRHHPDAQRAGVLAAVQHDGHVRRLREAPARPAGVAGERREGRAGGRWTR